MTWRKDNRARWATMDTSIASRKVVATAAIVDTSPRSDAASGDRHGRTGGRRFWIVRQCWWNDSQITSSTHSCESLEQIWREAQLIHSLSLSEGPRVGFMDNAQKITRAPCMLQKSWKSRGVGTTSHKNLDVVEADHKSFHWRTRIAITLSMCGSRSTRFGYSMDTEFSVQKQESTRYDGKCAAFLTYREHAWSYFTILENSRMLAKIL